MKQTISKLSKADEHEMAADAAAYLKAAGIAKPTKAQVTAQIEAEHGKKVAKAADQPKAKKMKTRKSLKQIFGFSVAAVARALGKRNWLPSDAITAIHSIEPKASKLAIKTYVQAGRAGVRGDPAPLTKEQLKSLKAALA